MIQLHGISKAYGRVRALAGVSLSVEPGHVTGLLGPNGAGKSTLIRITAGVLRPDRGAVHIAGHDATTHPTDARRALGYLPESAPLYLEMRPLAYLKHRARLFGLDAREAKNAARYAADRCDLAGTGRKRIAHLSKGFRQRVGLAAAIVHRPKVLVLDEPTNGLDPSQVATLRDLLASLARDRAVMLSSHVLHEVERVCGRIVVLARGRIAADDTPASLTPTTGWIIEAKQFDAESLRPQLATDARIAPLTTDADGWLRCRIESKHDPRNAIAAWARDTGTEIRELRAERATLEQRFADLVESSPAEEPAA